jgi:hypothetical protein
MTLSMNGYIFFASSVRLLEDAKQLIEQHEEAMLNSQSYREYSPLRQKRSMNSSQSMRMDLSFSPGHCPSPPPHSHRD